MISYLLKLIHLLGHPQVSLPAQEVLLETTDPDSHGNDWLYLNDGCGEFTTPLHPLQAALTQRLKLNIHLSDIAPSISLEGTSLNN